MEPQEYKEKRLSNGKVQSSKNLKENRGQDSAYLLQL